MSEESKEKVSNWNIANAFTVLRLILVPIFVGVMLAVASSQDVLRWLALGIFIFASLTDHIDGRLARKYNLITDFGKLADSIADKALTLSAFFLLSWQGLLWWWVTALILLRELGITVMRMFMKRIAVMPANQGGKLKTVLQMLLIVMLLTPWDVIAAGAWPGILLGCQVLSVMVVLVTVGTGLWYVRDAVLLWRSAG